MKQLLLFIFTLFAAHTFHSQVQLIEISQETDGTLNFKGSISGVKVDHRNFDTSKGIKIDSPDNTTPMSFVLKKKNATGEDITATNIESDSIKAQSDGKTLYLEVTFKGQTAKIEDIGRNFSNPSLILGSDANRRFIYSLGTNFDFIDNIKTDKSYHDLRFSDRNLNDTRIGLDVSLGRYRTFSKPDSITNPYYDTDPILVGDSLVGINYITSTVKEKSRRILDNWTIAVSPSIQINRKSSKDFYLGVFGQFEYQRTNFETSIERTITSDTSDHAIDWPIPYVITETLPEERSSIKISTDNFYYGGGLRTFYRCDVGILTASVGLGWSETHVIKADQTSQDYNAWYGVVKMEFIEYQKAGIKIGAEMRSFFGENAPISTLNLARFNVYLAKEISFNKIGELFSVD